MFRGINQKSTVCKEKARIRVFGRISSEFQCLDRKGQNSNDWKDDITILMLGEIRPEFQCLEREVRIPMFGNIKVRIPVF